MNDELERNNVEKLPIINIEAMRKVLRNLIGDLGNDYKPILVKNEIIKEYQLPPATDKFYYINYFYTKKSKEIIIDWGDE